MAKIRQRQENVTFAQKDIYVSFMENHLPMRSVNRCANPITQKLWRDLTKRLNSVEKGPQKNLNNWRKVFDNWRYVTRKKGRDVLNGALIHLSDMELRALACWENSSKKIAPMQQGQFNSAELSCAQEEDSTSTTFCEITEELDDDTQADEHEEELSLLDTVKFKPEVEISLTQRSQFSQTSTIPHLEQHAAGSAPASSSARASKRFYCENDRPEVEFDADEVNESAQETQSEKLPYPKNMLFSQFSEEFKSDAQLNSPDDQLSICQICPNKPKVRLNHIYLHNAYRFICKETQICDASFDNVEEVELHEFQAHGLENKRCNVCERTYATYAAMASHKTYMHRETERFVCFNCRECFASKDELALHHELLPKTCGYFTVYKPLLFQNGYLAVGTSTKRKKYPKVPRLKSTDKSTKSVVTTKQFKMVAAATRQNGASTSVVESAQPDKQKAYRSNPNKSAVTLKPSTNKSSSWSSSNAAIKKVEALNRKTPSPKNFDFDDIIEIDDDYADAKKPSSLYLSTLSIEGEAKLRTARQSHDEYRFVWLCPRCPQIFENKSTFRIHLLRHNMAEERNHAIFEVRPIPRNIVDAATFAKLLKRTYPTAETSKASMASKAVIITKTESDDIDTKLSKPLEVVIKTEPQEVEPSSAAHDLNLRIKKEPNEVIDESEFILPNVTAADIEIKQETNTCADTAAVDIQIKQETDSDADISETEQFSCKKCLRAFSTKYELIDHNRGDCERHPTIPCCLCTKKFYSTGPLKLHMGTHTGEEYRCEQCNKDFASYYQMYLHNRVHFVRNPQQSFVCPVCLEIFYHHGTFLAHKRQHIDPSLICPTCKTVCTTRMGVEKHWVNNPETCGKHYMSTLPHLSIRKLKALMSPMPK